MRDAEMAGGVSDCAMVERGFADGCADKGRSSIASPVRSAIVAQVQKSAFFTCPSDFILFFEWLPQIRMANRHAFRRHHSVPHIHGCQHIDGTRFDHKGGPE